MHCAVQYLTIDFWRADFFFRYKLSRYHTIIRTFAAPFFALLFSYLLWVVPYLQYLTIDFWRADFFQVEIIILFLRWVGEYQRYMPMQESNRVEKCERINSNYWYPYQIPRRVHTWCTIQYLRYTSSDNIIRHYSFIWSVAANISRYIISNIRI